MRGRIVDIQEVEFLRFGCGWYFGLRKKELGCEMLKVLFRGIE